MTDAPIWRRAGHHLETTTAAAAAAPNQYESGLGKAGAGSWNAETLLG